MPGDRIPCINPRCRRTAPAGRYAPGTEIICGKCLRALPKELRDRFRLIRRSLRTLERRVRRAVAQGRFTPEGGDVMIGRGLRRQDETWARIKAYYETPDKPVGLDAHLEEIGLL